MRSGRLRYSLIGICNGIMPLVNPGDTKLPFERDVSPSVTKKTPTLLLVIKDTYSLVYGSSAYLLGASNSLALGNRELSQY